MKDAEQQERNGRSRAESAKERAAKLLVQVAYYGAVAATPG